MDNSHIVRLHKCLKAQRQAKTPAELRDFVTMENEKHDQEVTAIEKKISFVSSTFLLLGIDG